MVRFVFLFSIVLFAIQSSAQDLSPHAFLRRIAVFPIGEISGANADEAWWQMRESLTKDQRLFVASRRFMVNRGVFQSRRQLKTADVVILAKILDAQAVVVSYVDERQFVFKVYEGETGFLLWQAQVEFHPAVPINDQIVKVAQKLADQFLSEIPYQATVVLDSVKEKVYFSEGAATRVWVKKAALKSVEIGDSAQFVLIRRKSVEALFQQGGSVEIFGDARVVEINDDRCLLEIDKIKALELLKEDTLVQFPKALKIAKEAFVVAGSASGLSTEYLTSEMKNVGEFEAKHSKTSTSLAFLFSLAGMILLAF